MGWKEAGQGEMTGILFWTRALSSSMSQSVSQSVASTVVSASISVSAGQSRLIAVSRLQLSMVDPDRAGGRRTPPLKTSPPQDQASRRVGRSPIIWPLQSTDLQ